MSVPKDHHLLPAFYLRGFCDGELHKGEGHEDNPKRCRVFIHDRVRGKCRGRGVKNVAVERHFYSADTPGGGRDPESEEKLGVLETRASRIIRGLAYGQGLTDVQRAWLARFVAYMKFRTPGYRDWTKLFAEQNTKALKDFYFPTLDSMRDYLRTRGVPVDAMPEKIEELYARVHDESYKLPVTKNYMLLRMFELGDKVAEVLFSFDWTFAWADERTSFVTSDDPLVVLDERMKPPDAYAGNVGVASPKTTKVLPLRQDICLLIGTGAPSVRHVRLDRKTVRELNLKQARHYDLWLIARDQRLCERVMGAV